MADETAELVACLARRHLTLAVAESLTGGELTAEFTRPAGASAVVLGGAVVYATELKHTIAGVDAALLAERGPVDPEVAIRLARGIRHALAVGGRAADIGVATTGVAGPDPQGGQEPGTVFIGISTDAGSHVLRLALAGSRAEVRAATVAAAVVGVRNAVGEARE